MTDAERRDAALWGLAPDSWCPIIKGPCVTKCVFHVAERDVNDEWADEETPDDDLYRTCKLVSIAHGLHELLGHAGDNRLTGLVERMDDGELTVNVIGSLNTYE